MTTQRFRAGVGYQRVPGRFSNEFRQNTANVRRQMALIVEDYERLIHYIEDVTPEVIFDALEPTFEKSKEYCPKDTGDLVKSGYLEIVDGRVEIGYGRGGNPSYAVTVHENLEWRHKAPTRAKWLQVALDEDEQQIQNRILTRLGRIFN